MNKTEINEFVDCLPRGRTPFYYFKDRYALMLMRLPFGAPALFTGYRKGGKPREVLRQAKFQSMTWE